MTIIFVQVRQLEVIYVTFPSVALTVSFLPCMMIETCFKSQALVGVPQVLKNDVLCTKRFGFCTIFMHIVVLMFVHYLSPCRCLFEYVSLAVNLLQNLA